MNTLWQLIESLNPKERKAARTYLRKEFALHPCKEFDLFALILKGKTPENIQARLFPLGGDDSVAAKKKASGAFRKLCSQLKTRLETFLLLQFLEENPIDRNQLLAPLMAKRGLSSSFQRQVNVSEKLLEEKPPLDAEASLHRYQLSVLQHNLKQMEQQAKATPLLSQTLERFDAFWAIEKYQHLLAVLHHERSGQPTRIERPLLWEELLTLTAPHTPLGAIPGMSLLRDICLFQLNRGTLSYLELSERLKQQVEHISPKLLANLFSSLLPGFLQANSRDGTHQDRQALYEWYQWGLQHDLLSRNGVILPKHYQNFLGPGIHLGRWEEVEQYMKELGPLLPGGTDSDVYKLMLAAFLFEKGDKRAVQSLRNLSFHSPITSISVRFYLIKAAFDLDETETIENDLKTICMRLSRANNLSDVHRQVLKSRHKRMKELAQANDGLPAVQACYEAVEADPPGPDKSWLLGYLAPKIQP